MSPRREAVTVTDTFGDWTPITVHLNGDISARERTVPYKGGMFAAYPGDVVFSRIDARNGAIGVLQEGIAKAVVTSEFPVFVPVPDRLDGGFVKLVLRTGNFLAALRTKASGTSGRKRITPDAFADLRVPLPPLNEQRAIVAAHRTALARAADLERKAEEVEARAMEAFEAALGFGPPAPLPKRPVFIASFKDLDRWSHEGILRATLSLGKMEPRFPIVELGVCAVERYFKTRERMDGPESMRGWAGAPGHRSAQWRTGHSRGSEASGKTPDGSDSGHVSLASRRPYTARSGCRRLMFSARHTKSHSPRALFRPRTLNRRNPRTSLIQPLGASDSHLRCAYRSRPAGVASFSTIRCVAGCVCASRRAVFFPSRPGATYPSIPRASSSDKSRSLQ